MLKRKQNKKKKAFTLIELVIVLAVLAIIALIAIPNFTRVRNDSLKSADDRSKEQIEDIIEMAIANEYVKPGTITIAYTGATPAATSADSAIVKGAELNDLLLKTAKPQWASRTGYTITIDGQNVISATFTP